VIVMNIAATKTVATAVCGRILVVTACELPDGWTLCGFLFDSG